MGADLTIFHLYVRVIDDAAVLVTVNGRAEQTETTASSFAPVDSVAVLLLETQLPAVPVQSKV